MRSVVRYILGDLKFEEINPNLGFVWLRCLLGERSFLNFWAYMANYGNLQATLPTRRGESKIKITKFPLFGISFPKWTPKKLPRFALAFFSKKSRGNASNIRRWLASFRSWKIGSSGCSVTMG